MPIKRGALIMNTLKSILQSASILAFTVISLSACQTVVYQSSGPSGGGSGGPIVYVDPYKHAWYDVYGTQCTNYGYPMSGCNFYADGSKITSSGDPYFASKTLYFDYWTYTDSYGYRRDYQGYAWLSSTGILYDSSGNALNEMDDEGEQSSDIIALASQKETEAAKRAGKALSQKYALAEDAGVNIAKTLQDWAVLGRDRARTTADVADFSKRLYGVELSRASNALQEAVKGNKEALTEVNVDVAAHWGTSPETSKEILSQWYKEELTQLGVK